MRKTNGFVLIATLLIMILFLSLGSYFLSFVITEDKIARSHSLAYQTYYLAEAGVGEAIWKLKNDSDWKNNFETNPLWQAEFTRTNIFFQGDSYTVRVKNSDYAKGEITVTANISLPDNKKTQRIIKTKVFKAQNPNFLKDVAIFSDTDISIQGTQMTVTGGGIFTNEDMDFWAWTNVNVGKKAQAVEDIEVWWESSLEAGSLVEAQSCSGNITPWPCQSPPSRVQMPMIDFDSNDPDSYKNRAINVYSSNEFKDLLKDNPTLTISGITYVTGKIQIRRGQHLTVNGILLADGNIEIGTGWQGTGQAWLIVNHSPSEPAGILTKSRIWIGNWTSQINIQGLMYANDRIDIAKLNPNFIFNLEGGVMSRGLNTSTLWQTLNIIYNETIIQEALAQSLFSPVVTVEHWEEEY